MNEAKTESKPTLREILHHVDEHSALPDGVVPDEVIQQYVEPMDDGTVQLNSLGELEMDDLDEGEADELRLTLERTQADLATARIQATNLATELVAFANANNRINLTGHLARAVELAREVVKGGAS